MRYKTYKESNDIDFRKDSCLDNFYVLVVGILVEEIAGDDLDYEDGQDAFELS